MVGKILPDPGDQKNTLVACMKISFVLFDLIQEHLFGTIFGTITREGQVLVIDLLFDSSPRERTRGTDGVEVRKGKGWDEIVFRDPQNNVSVEKWKFTERSHRMWPPHYQPARVIQKGSEKNVFFRKNSKKIPRSAHVREVDPSEHA